MSSFDERVRLVEEMLDRSRSPDVEVTAAITELARIAESHEQLDRVEELVAAARAKYGPWLDEKVVPIRP